MKRLIVASFVLAACITNKKDGEGEKPIAKACLEEPPISQISLDSLLLSNPGLYQGPPAQSNCRENPSPVSLDLQKTPLTVDFTIYDSDCESIFQADGISIDTAFEKDFLRRPSFYWHGRTTDGKLAGSGIYFGEFILFKEGSIDTITYSFAILTPDSCVLR